MSYLINNKYLESEISLDDLKVFFNAYLGSSNNIIKGKYLMFSMWKKKVKRLVVHVLEGLVLRIKDPSVVPIYDDLTPNDDIDKDGIYAGAIRSSLENKNVHNIALTGPYGSGKSSILKTFEKNNKKNYNFLKISLATFGSKTNSSSSNDHEQEEKRALEKSILQQMIYRVQDKTIPFSRFRKIRHMRSMQTTMQLFLFLIFIAGIVYFFVPSFIGTLYNSTLLSQSEKTLSLVSSILLVIFICSYGFFLLKHIYNLLRGNLNFKKVTIANASIEMDKTKDDNSIFDKFIDEILYFFQATKYDVVVFEDLDRFDSLEIFEQLRELNALINNSELIKRRVVFVYAIKDDIFGDVDSVEQTRNRIKFFDFIIPVIPILHTSNSIEVLSEKLKTSPYKSDIDSNFLQDISLYIDDMRVLINIFTEFDIYMKKLGGDLDLDSNKLFAIIIYKNLYPIDFSRLQNNQGHIYQMVKRRETLINQQLTMLEDKIKDMEQKIEASKDEQLASIEELQNVYIQSYNNKLRINNHNFYIRLDNTTFGNNSNYQITESFFEKLENAKNIYYNLGEGNKQVTLEKIATVFGTKENYFKRKTSTELKNEEKLESFKKKLSHLKRKKSVIYDLSLKELIADKNEKVFPETILEEGLLVYLLRHGYIDDTYHHYISYFYPGSLSKRDMDFILSIKNFKARDFSYSLQNVEKVISRLKVSEFKQVEILNYDLLDFVLENNKYQEQFNLVLNQLVVEENTPFQFIKGFNERTTNKELFIKKLCHEWDNIWVYIMEESNFSDEEVQSFLTDILHFSDVADIEKLNKKMKLANYIAKLNDYLKVSKDLPLTKEKDILKRIQVKFKNTAHLRPKADLFNYVVEENLYQINKKTLSDILQGKVKHLTYSNLKNAKEDKVFSYIDKKINLFVEKVLLDEEFSQETEETIIELLNRESLENYLKERIIDKLIILINDIADVDQHLWKSLFERDKIVVSWYNILQYILMVETLDDTMIDFLNKSKNADELAKYKLVDEVGEEDRRMLSEKIMKSDEIKNDSFEKLTASIIKWRYYPTDELSLKRVKIMIEKKVISLSVKSYDNIKENHRELCVLLIKENIGRFINHQKDYNLDLEEVEMLFHSDILVNYKIELVKQMDTSILSESKETLVFVSELARFIVQNDINVSDDMLKALFNFNMEMKIKLMLLTSQVKVLELEQITNLLNSLGESYAAITESGKRPTITKNDLNEALLSELKKKDYISNFKIEGNEKFRVITYGK
ncbi:YobI family P-loop NTPase [Alkalicoccobacillus gibsonii]|uniref:YobI family P-loop NTPase n=1 Tax=Alkalicoccobacillus gibsonii TaxID=79881 RepID=UPI003F7BDCE1